MKGVQCYELFGEIALKNHAFSFSFIKNDIVKTIDFGNILREFANKKVRNFFF